MLTPVGPKVLEYNVRFGDPETEALMLLLDEKTDLAAVLLVCMLILVCLAMLISCQQACAERRLDSVNIGIRSGSAVSVILASSGYPGSYPKGKTITIQEVSEGIAIHVGIARRQLTPVNRRRRFSRRYLEEGSHHHNVRRKGVGCYGICSNPSQSIGPCLRRRR